MFGIFGDTATRRVPGRFQVPWTAILLVAILLIVLAVGAREEIVSRITSGDAPAPAAQVAVPAVSNPQVPAVVAPVIPLVEVQWVQIGTARSGAEGRALPIPWDKFLFVPGTTLREELNLPEGFHAKGDGVVFLAKKYRDENPEFFFTPDRGVTWFKLANNPPIKILNNGSPEVGGAFVEGKQLTLFLATEVEPWVYKYWRAEIPLATIKGLSP